MENNLEKLAFEWIMADKDDVKTDEEYYCQTRDVFQTRLDRMKNDLLSKKEIGEEDVYIASAIAGEIGNNSFDHNLGNWPDISGTFFGCEILNGKLKIALADRGQGILATLGKVKKDLKNDEEALKVAFTERISGRAPENRGNGLKFVSENVESRKMHLIFISGNAKAEINEKMEIKTIEDNLSGCLAILTL
jgi:hypothetical protein